VTSVEVPPEPATDSGPHTFRILLRELLVREIVAALYNAKIPVMPLKGVLFAYWLYNDPAERDGSDVDLLVPESRFRQAIDVLAARGFSELAWPTSTHQRSLLSLAVPIVVDLHQTLFPRAYYQLSTADLFARGKEDRTRFGNPVFLPDPYDAYAHLVGHAAAAHFTVLPAQARKDLSRLPQHFRLQPDRCADHLRRTGLSRAALYTLSCLGPVDEFADLVVERLSSDRMGRWQARTASYLARHFPYSSAPAQYSVLLTNSSLTQSARRICRRLADRFHRGQ
jgi:hypothetical protein